jgi:hypothetical protein
VQLSLPHEKETVELCAFSSQCEIVDIVLFGICQRPFSLHAFCANAHKECAISRQGSCSGTDTHTLLLVSQSGSCEIYRGEKGLLPLLSEKRIEGRGGRSVTPVSQTESGGVENPKEENTLGENKIGCIRRTRRGWTSDVGRQTDIDEGRMG